MKFLAFFSIYCLYLLSSSEAKAHFSRCQNIQIGPEQKGIANSPEVSSTASKIDPESGKILVRLVPSYNLSVYVASSYSIGNAYSASKVGAKDFYFRSGLSPPVLLV